MYPYIIKAEYWDDISDPWALKHIQVLLYAESHSDAVSRFENSHYVENIETIKAIAAGDEYTFFEVPGHIAKILAAGAGNYRDGLEELQGNEKIAKKLKEDAEKVIPRENFTINIPLEKEEI